MTKRERPLEFSDIVSGHHAEILADPYGFLGLPQNTPFVDVRRRYLGMAKLYHPDMINPHFDSDEAVQERIAQLGIEGLNKLISQAGATSTTDEEFSKAFNAGMLSATGIDFDKRRNALRLLQALAHKRMVELNVAYEAVKLKLNPKERNILAGYKTKDVKDEWGARQVVDLEGQGVLEIFSNDPPPSYFWMPGPYLRFDWSPPSHHRWINDPEEMDYSEMINIKHLFVNQEISEGRSDISPVLLEPFYKHFNLNAFQQRWFPKLLIANAHREYAYFKTMDIMGALKIPSDEDRDETSYSAEYRTRIRGHISEMVYLDSSFHPFYRPDVDITKKFDNGKLSLKAYTESVFSETDVILMQTLAYGPMLSSN